MLCVFVGGVGLANLEGFPHLTAPIMDYFLPPWAVKWESYCLPL